MREIEFRGLDKKGIWVYGLIATLSDGVTLIIESSKGGYKHKQLIAPVTIGQYIGIKDIHQKKVFQGDIVKVENIIYTDCWKDEVERIDAYVGEVVWSQFGWNVAETVKGKIQGKTYEVIRYHSLWLWNGKDDETDPESDFMEIIGNRWDNPEMKVIDLKE